jgi:4a-hydroxytetrahydrobiopterin dehydratase
MKITKSKADKLLRKKENLKRVDPQQLRKLRQQNRSWKVVKNHHLNKAFKFDDFKGALAFVSKVGKLADRMEHHPDVLLTYGNAELTIFDHKTNGLTPLDFALAGEVDRIFKNGR